MSAERPEQADGVEVNEVSDGLVIYQADPDRVHHLNRTATLVYELSDGRHDERAIAALVQQAFGLDSQPEADVRECIADLRAKGIVR